MSTQKPRNYVNPFRVPAFVVAFCATIVIIVGVIAGVDVLTHHTHSNPTAITFVPQPVVSATPSKIAVKTNPDPAKVVVHGATTAAICKQLGSQDTMGGTPDADLGIVDESECLIGNVIYTVDKFENNTYRDSWIAGEKKLGIFAKWQGDDWSAVWYDPSAASNFSS
jgi:hypothetical protein